MPTRSLKTKLSLAVLLPSVALFVLIGSLSGYWRAHQAGLTRSRCYLRDVRLVLLYLGLVLVAALAGIAWTLHGWLT